MLIVVRRFGFLRVARCVAHSEAPLAFSLDVQIKDMRKIEQ